MNHRLFIGISVLLFGLGHVTAQNVKTMTETTTVSVFNNDCKKTTTFYYDQDDNKILHGPMTVKGTVNNTQDPNNTFKFRCNESVNYVHGKENGKYKYSQKTDKKTTSGYGRLKTVTKTNTIDSVSGAYKEGNPDGVWIFYYSYKEATVGGSSHNKLISTSLTFKNGVLAGYKNNEGVSINFTTVVDTETGTPFALVSGKIDEYTIRNGIVTNYFQRKNGDITPIDDIQLKKILPTVKNPLSKETLTALYQAGFGLVRCVSTVPQFDLTSYFQSSSMYSRLSKNSPLQFYYMPVRMDKETTNGPCIISGPTCKRYTNYPEYKNQTAYENQRLESAKQ